MAAVTNLDLRTPDVASVADLIREHANAAEANRRMAPEVMTALIDTGMFRMWAPRELGGLELDANESLDVIEDLTRIDAATGWVVSNCNFITTVAQFLPPAPRDAVVRARGPVCCGSFVPPGAAVPDGDGYRVSGNWTFGSASHYATCLVVLTLLSDANGPVFGPDGVPTSVVAYLDPADVRILDTWHTLGLRATGSTNFTADNLFVPAERTFLLGAWESTEGPFATPFYRLGPVFDAVRIARVGVGIAQGAIDDFVELALAKTPAYSATLTADRATVQERLARAQALVQAARHTLRAVVTESLALVQDGSRIVGDRCVPMGLASVFALESAVKAVDLLHESAGSTAFRDESSLQRRFRDLQTLRQNTIASWSRYESLGKLILGRPTDWAFYNV
ncbi:MAG: acyl-CoA dehydrogenase family protein [Acidimicrobiales bacterium]